MFRRLWKTLKFFLIIGVILICLPHSILPKQKSDSGKNDIEQYIKLNNQESRLTEYKDDEEALDLKLKQLDVINNSRRKFGAGTVKLDILASRVANKIAREAAENKFIGHWNLKGEKPYHRYAFAGGYDHISENAFGEWSSDNYVKSASEISLKMESGHSTFMSEKAPYDGHKKNITDKSHNFVGIGYYLSGNQFRYYEEFIDRYIEFEDIPATVRKDEICNITVNTNGESFLYYMIIYREEYPEPMGPEQISNMGGYDDFSSEQYIRIPAWELAGYRKGSKYKIPLRFTKEGLYYIQIFIDRKEIATPSSVSTKGKTPVSGIIISVK